MSNKITGMMKFLKRDYLITQSFTPTVSTGSDSFINTYDLDDSTYWISIGSNDFTEETIDVVFDVSQNIDRIVLRLMNFKEFTLQYWDGAAYADFQNVFSSQVQTGVSGGSYGNGVYGQTQYSNEAGDLGIYEIWLCELTSLTSNRVINAAYAASCI